MRSAPQPRRARSHGARRLLVGATTLGLTAAAAVTAVAGHADTGAADAPAALNADSFVASIGVNVHFGYDNVYSSRRADLFARLAELGVRNVRDGGRTAMPILAQLNAATGIKADMIVDTRANRGAPLDPNGIGGELDAITTTMPKAVGAIENPNEVDLNHGSGYDWAGNLRDYAGRLYGAVKSHAGLQDSVVVGPSLTSGGAYAAVGDVSSSVDVANAHPYLAGRHPGTPGWGDDGYGSVDWTLRTLTGVQAPGKGRVFTEAGYHNAVGAGGHVGTPEAVDGKYTPRMFLENYRRGVAVTFKYELVDEGAPSDTDPEVMFGLLRNDLSEKPSFVATKNLVNLLKDPGCANASGALAYGLQGDTSDVRQMLFRKCDGGYYLALWQEKPSYDPNTKATSTVPDRPLTLTLPGPSDVAGARVLDSGTFAPIASNASSVKVNVPDQPLILAITGPGSGGGSPTASPTATSTATSTATPTATAPPAAGTPTGPSAGAVADGTYKIIGVQSGKALDVEGCSTANAARVQIWPYWGGGCQQWKVRSTGGGYYALTSVKSNQVLDVGACSTEDRAPVDQWPWWGGDCQQWKIQGNGDGTYALLSKRSGKALDAAGCSTTDGIKLIQWPYWGGDCQKWRLEKP